MKKIIRYLDNYDLGIYVCLFIFGIVNYFTELQWYFYFSVAISYTIINGIVFLFKLIIRGNIKNRR